MGGCFCKTLTEHYGNSLKSEDASSSIQQYFVRKALSHFGLGEPMFDTEYVPGTRLGPPRTPVVAPRAELGPTRAHMGVFPGVRLGVRRRPPGE